jgi:uncharacterized protein
MLGASFAGASPARLQISGRERCATWEIDFMNRTGLSETSPSLVEAMMMPEFYPKPPEEVTHRETHISHVFFAGDLVYKIKKPVRFPFLDFSTLHKRRHFLQEELRLNRRLAPSVYLGVLPISLDENGWRLGGWGEPAEYTLVMRRLPDKRLLSFLLETKQASVALVEQLADHLAAFHAAAEPLQGMTPATHWSAVRASWNNNLDELEPLLTGAADRQACAMIRSYGAEFLGQYQDLFARRVAGGWIRDVHGDLHAEHICFAREGIQIFDCIEFDPGLRRCDLAAEIAFLSMDMSVRGGEALVRPFMERYLTRIGDPEMTALLPFYQAYRALVRAKVHGLRLRKWNDVAARYFTFAQRWAWQRFKPFLLLVIGLTGSGKSTLARELSARLGVIVIRSDAVRKRIAGQVVRQDAAPNEGMYTQAMTERTYGKMLREAESRIQERQGVIVDATFGRRSHREKFRRLAMKHRIPFFVLHCSASDATTARRLAQRAAAGTDISDGRWDVYVAQKAAYEALDEGPRNLLLNLPTDATVDQLVYEAAAFLRARLERPKVALQGGAANVQSSSRLRTGARRDFFSP